MENRLEEARTFYTQTQPTLVMIFESLWTQVVQKEQYEDTRSRQQKEIAFLESNGTVLREAAAKTLTRQKLKLAASEAGIKSTDLTINILAGTVLQIAKQAIAIRHGVSIDDCELQGRDISGSCVRDLIWIGRNQAMHYEETSATKTPVLRKSGWVDLFAILDSHHEGIFSLTPPFESKAMEIIKLLGWNRFDRYEADMQDLAIV